MRSGPGWGNQIGRERDQNRCTWPWLANMPGSELIIKRHLSDSLQKPMRALA